jgi:hypothetical protein
MCPLAAVAPLNAHDNLAGGGQDRESMLQNQINKAPEEQRMDLSRYYLVSSCGKRYLRVFSGVGERVRCEANRTRSYDGRS